jgi:PAS domain S-box-containing protein
MADAPPPAILIVDDDEGLTRLIGRALKRQNLLPVSANTGAEALALLEAGPPPELMLLDLKLPDIDTNTLLDRMARLDRPVPFVVITGQGDERVAVEMMKRGALDYLVKDAQFLDLVPIVATRTLEQLHRESRLAAAEAALRREHDFSNAVLKGASALMVVADPQGRIISINPACERLAALSLQEARGRDLGATFLGGMEWGWLSAQIDRSLARAKPFEREAYLSAGKLGRRLIAWSITAQVNDAGAVDYIIASGMDITERRRLEQEIIEVSDREQIRIGQDLHDGLCQVLAGINMLAVVLKRELAANARPEAADAEAIAAYASKAVAQARAVSRGLSPVELETHGLMAALEELAASTEKLFKVRCQFVCQDHVLIRDNAKATHLYRIAQEAISNAVKHGQAANITITLSDGDRTGHLIITDDGSGFAGAAPSQGRGKGMGLRTMNYRATIIGATLAIESLQPRGTRVTCSFPAD